jgi:hypothetical protein
MIAFAQVRHSISMTPSFSPVVFRDGFIAAQMVPVFAQTVARHYANAQPDSMGKTPHTAAWFVGLR